MTPHPVLLSIAAFLCGAPATILAVVMLPWSLAFGVYGLMEQPVLAIANLFLVFASVFSLAYYWFMAARTIKGLTLKLNWSFRIACIFAIGCIGIVLYTLPILGALVAILPILSATTWCLFRQSNLQGQLNA